MTKVLIGADVGGTKTAVAVSRDGKVVGEADGPGAALRPGRALVSSSTIADVVRQALAAAGLLTGNGASPPPALATEDWCSRMALPD